MTTTHVHFAPQDGASRILPDGTERADDECDCGQLLCPDTGVPVRYNSPSDPTTFLPDGPSYWHLDGTVCFLHQTSVPTTSEEVQS